MSLELVSSVALDSTVDVGVDSPCLKRRCQQVKAVIASETDGVRTMNFEVRLVTEPGSASTISMNPLTPKLGMITLDPISWLHVWIELN